MLHRCEQLILYCMTCIAQFPCLKSALEQMIGNIRPSYYAIKQTQKSHMPDQLIRMIQKMFAVNPFMQSATWRQIYELNDSEILKLLTLFVVHLKYALHVSFTSIAWLLASVSVKQNLVPCSGRFTNSFRNENMKENIFYLKKEHLICT